MIAHKRPAFIGLASFLDSAALYAAVDAIDWPQGFCRREIGWRAVGEG